MRPILGTTVALAAAALLGAALYIYLGAFNVAADEPHSAPVYALLNYARIRSIQVRAAGLEPPAGYDRRPKLLAAVAHFVAHCSLCHGAPGAKSELISEGMYPEPPNLARASQRFTPGELFWILKHGIKMSGMPSMADDGDDLLWATVAFLQKLPTLTPDDYNALKLASQAGGHSGMMDMSTMDMPKPATDRPDNRQSTPPR